MKENTTGLSIIITHYQTPRLLLHLLKKLGNKPNNVEIIVVDSKAQKGLRFLMRKEFRGVIYLPFQKNVGYAKITNAGVKTAKGAYILIINADITIELREVKKILTFMKAHPNGAAVGVSACFRFPSFHTVLARRTAWGKTPRGKKELSRYEMHDYSRKEPSQVDWVRGDCWMIRKKALEKIGLLDERFFMYFEDTDWCRRARGFGYAIYFLPGISITAHKPGASRQKTLKGLLYRSGHLISFLKYSFKWNKPQDQGARS